MTVRAIKSYKFSPELLINSLSPGNKKNNLVFYQLKKINPIKHEKLSEGTFVFVVKCFIRLHGLSLWELQSSVYHKYKGLQLA